jgi:NTP pyrophosphatase (non-canonical NTP hydrolase)
VTRTKNEKTLIDGLEAERSRHRQTMARALQAEQTLAALQAVTLTRLQERAAVHHQEQFGDPPVSIRSLKIGEEAGEVQGAIVRHLAKRDGRSWLPEVRSELGDLAVAMAMTAESLGISLEQAVVGGFARFLEREWVVDKFPSQSEERV